MGLIDDLSVSRAELDELKRRMADLEARDPLANSAVSGGRTRFIGENSFLIEGSGGVTGTLTIEGLEVVNGELRIRGQLNVTGPTALGGDTDVTGNFTVTGPTALNGKTTVNGDTTVAGPFRVNGPLGVYGKATINGDTTVEGPFRVNGPMGVYGALGIHGQTAIDGNTSIDGDTDINGSLGINGNTRVSGDVAVVDGGDITVDNMRIGRIPGTTQGGIDFGVGQLRSTGDRTVLQSGDAVVGARSNQVALLFGDRGIEVFSSGVYLQGVAGAPSGTALFPVVTDSNGKLYRAPQSN